MKKSLDRDFDPAMDERERMSVEALTIEALEPRNRRRRSFLFVLAIVLIGGIAAAGFVSRAVGLDAKPSVSPPPPTPISWSNRTVDAATLPSPAPARSLSPGDPTPNPHPRTPLSVQMKIPGGYWQKSHGNHFTLVLMNTSGLEVPFDPCPTYRMYIAGTDVTASPLHLLNCEAIGSVLSMGRTVTLDMVYEPAADDPIGNQTLVWSWVLPEDYQATTTARILLAP